MDTCICMAEPLCSPPETNTTLLIIYIPTQSKELKKENALHPPNQELSTSELPLASPTSPFFFALCVWWVSVSLLVMDQQHLPTRALVRDAESLALPRPAEPETALEPDVRWCICTLRCEKQGLEDWAPSGRFAFSPAPSACVWGSGSSSLGESIGEMSMLLFLSWLLWVGTRRVIVWQDLVSPAAGGGSESVAGMARGPASSSCSRLSPGQWLASWPVQRWAPGPSSVHQPGERWGLWNGFDLGVCSGSACSESASTCWPGTFWVLWSFGRVADKYF